MNIREAFNTPLGSLTSVVFPQEDQDAIFNRELRIAIHSARILGKNAILDGKWMGLRAVGAISQWHEVNLATISCNVCDEGRWSAMEDDQIIVHCGGTL